MTCICEPERIVKKCTQTPHPNIHKCFHHVVLGDCRVCVSCIVFTQYGAWNRLGPSRFQAVHIVIQCAVEWSHALVFWFDMSTFQSHENGSLYSTWCIQSDFKKIHNILLKSMYKSHWPRPRSGRNFFELPLVLATKHTFVCSDLKPFLSSKLYTRQDTSLSPAVAGAEKSNSFRNGLCFAQVG